jgi:DNA-binding NtrC family response regulator
VAATVRLALRRSANTTPNSSETLRQIILKATILNQAGFQASAFDHAEKAIAAIVELTPALLVSDVMMPGMTGVKLAIHFRKSHPECKVLLFSGHASTADLLERVRAEGYDFDLLSKPVHPGDLLVCSWLLFC